MGIHINSNLDQDQRICRQVSFYDLVELMTFGRLSFSQSCGLRLTSLTLPSKGKEMITGISSKRGRTASTAATMHSSPASAAIAYQSWTLLEQDHAIDWGYDDASAPTIHIVSTIRALAESLLVGKNSEVFIDRTSRVVPSPEQLRSGRGTAVPTFDDGTLTVTLWPQTSSSENQQSVLRLSVDLKTLLAGVLVSPKAPTRFVELISNLVQRNTGAKVTRASWPMEAVSAGTAYARRA